jgi:hypothetical protein
MHVKIFYGMINEVENPMNEWLADIDRTHIIEVKIVHYGHDAQIMVFIFWD